MFSIIHNSMKESLQTFFTFLEKIVEDSQYSYY